MTTEEAIKILDDVIPPPDGIMNLAQLKVAVAWETVKSKVINNE